MRGSDFVYFHKVLFGLIATAQTLKLFIGSALSVLAQKYSAPLWAVKLPFVLFSICALLWGAYWSGVKKGSPLLPKRKQAVSLILIIISVALDIYVALAAKSYGWLVAAGLVIVFSIPYFHALKHPESLREE